MNKDLNNRDICRAICLAQKIITTLCTQYELDRFEHNHLDTAFWELSEVYKSFYKKAE